MDAETLLNMAVESASQGRMDEALAFCDQVLAVNPGSPAAWNAKGSILMASRRFREALESLEKAQQAGGDPEAAQGIAVCRQALGQPVPPVQAAEAAAWHFKGATFAREERLEEALACFEKVLAICPRSAETLYDKAVVLGKLDRVEEELACYDQALAIAPGLELAWFNKGHTLASAFARYADAVECFEKAKQLGHPTAERGIEACVRLMSEALFGTSTPAAAEPEMDAEAWHNKGAALAEEERFDDALTCFEKALTMSPQSAVVWFDKGVVLGKLGRAEEELSCYDRALAIKPEYTLAWFIKGVALASSFERYPEAIKCFEKAEQLGHPSAAQAIAVCQKRMAESK